MFLLGLMLMNEVLVTDKTKTCIHPLQVEITESERCCHAWQWDPVENRALPMPIHPDDVEGIARVLSTKLSATETASTHEIEKSHAIFTGKLAFSKADPQSARVDCTAARHGGVQLETHVNNPEECLPSQEKGGPFFISLQRKRSQT